MFWRYFQGNARYWMRSFISSSLSGVFPISGNISLIMPVVRNGRTPQSSYEVNGWHNPIALPLLQSHGSYSSSTPSPPSQNFKSIAVSDRDPASDSAYTGTPDSASPSEFSPHVPKKKRRGRRTEDRVPRPRNAFIIFRSYYINSLKAKASADSDHAPITDISGHHRHTLNMMTATTTKQCVVSATTASSDNQQNELSKQAAKLWNKMDLEERKPYTEQARKEKEWHRAMYPDYMYCPTNPNAKGKRTKSMGKESAKSIKEMSKSEPSTKDQLAIPPEMDSERFLFHQQLESPYPSVLAPAIPQPAPAPAPSVAAEQVAFQHSTAPSAEVEVVHSRGSDYRVDNGSIQLEQEYYSHNGFLSRHDLVPMDAIPPLALCPSSRGFDEVQCKDDKFPDLRQPAFAVDLSPRSLAYEQAKILLDSQSCSPTSVFAFFAMQDGGGDTNAPSFPHGEDAIQTHNAPFIATPTPFLAADPGPAAYPSSSLDYSSFGAEPFAASTSMVPESTTTAAIPDWTDHSACFDFDLSSSYVEPIPLSFFEPPVGVDGCIMPAELEVDVPQFDFQLLSDDGSHDIEGARMLDAFFYFGIWGGQE